MHLVNARSIGLAPASAASTTVWVEVTEAGDYRGYPGGGFKFDQSTFQKIVANFRRHPSYRAVGGEGVADVVAWDFNHASEFAPSEGSIPAHGTPAQGWIQELAIRAGAAGKAQLWAKTRWLEPARTYVLQGAYKWASVVVDFAATDPITGKPVGATLVSVALTNNPFVEGMVPLVAASKHVARIAASRNGSSQSAPKSPRFLGTLRRVTVARNKSDDYKPFDPGQLAQQIGDSAIIGRSLDGSGPTISVRFTPESPYVDVPAPGASLTDWLAAYCPQSTPEELQALADQLSPIFEALQAEAAQLSQSPGRNLHEKAIVALRAIRPGYEKLSWENQVREASRLVRRIA